MALTLGGLAISAFGARWTLLYAGGLPVLAAVAGLAWMRLRLIRAALPQEALELAREQVA